MSIHQKTAACASFFEAVIYRCKKAMKCHHFYDRAKIPLN